MLPLMSILTGANAVALRLSKMFTMQRHASRKGRVGTASLNCGASSQPRRRSSKEVAMKLTKRRDKSTREQVPGATERLPEERQHFPLGDGGTRAEGSALNRVLAVQFGGAQVFGRLQNKGQLV